MQCCYGSERIGTYAAVKGDTVKASITPQIITVVITVSWVLDCGASMVPVLYFMLSFILHNPVDGYKSYACFKAETKAGGTDELLQVELGYEV